MTAGEHPFALKNLKEENLSLIVIALLDGHTFQDLVDRISEQGTNWPDWLGRKRTRFVAFDKGESTGEEIISLDIRREGEYVITIYNGSNETF